MFNKIIAPLQSASITTPTTTTTANTTNTTTTNTAANSDSTTPSSPSDENKQIAPPRPASSASTSSPARPVDTASNRSSSYRSITNYFRIMGQHLSKNKDEQQLQQQQQAESLRAPYEANSGVNASSLSSSSSFLRRITSNKNGNGNGDGSATATTPTAAKEQDDLSLIPITSPPDEPHQYPSAFFLSPITSNESYNYYSDDASMIDVNHRSYHNHRNQNLHYNQHYGHHHPHEDQEQEESLRRLKQLETSITNQLGDISPASSYAEEVEPISKEAVAAPPPVPALDGSQSEEQFFQEQFSPLLALPLEILYRIIEYVYVDTDVSSINSNLEKFANTIPLLSKKFHQLSLCFIYKYTIFNRPHSFDKFLHNLEANPIIGKYVEFMDFQQFTSIGLGRTGRMNQEIQMVTSRTIAHALSMTPKLSEFLASENIQDDLDVNVLDYLFNKLPKMKALDFCGASSEAFARAFEELPIESPLSITKLSLHDCSNLSQDVLEKVLTHSTRLKRLDLNHTAISSTILLKVAPTVRLTHLSLARCSKLTTKDLIHFLTTHPATSQNSLEWLNLQIDTNVVSPLSDAYLLYTLRHLNAPNLKYLNIGGMPINYRILLTIKARFPLLTSLNISHASQLTVDELNDFMKDNTAIKYLDVTGVKSLNKNIITFLKCNFNSNLEALEFDYKQLYEYTNRGDCFRVQPQQQSFLDDITSLNPQIWKFYDNEGRRAWIYKMNEREYKKVNQSNLVFYDLETGNKIVTKSKKPEFLKYAGRKVNCSIGYYQLNGYKDKKHVEDVWPVEFSQRGIYNYYSLNVK
ncbi:uncharacterized protein LODBEIA_P18510 [Lodderomyces beijingensis]|uniref:F-box domain-containing protein n=1 Tax=Lodderomyces beijingensis TaxID=1775926 RepID=A0ABP0ZJL6_9ASCO